ncbi:MAG: hypothetical protein GY943_21025 [Chloroflexi bacterium]|nr:hypothetical protein [Chloroflexota bacterium]
METIPIQVTGDGVLIPREYFLHDANEYEVELTDSYILIKPKVSEAPLPDVHKRYPWIGIGHSSDPTASQRVEEILADEIDRRSGWTQKSGLDE